MTNTKTQMLNVGAALAAALKKGGRKTRPYKLTFARLLLPSLILTGILSCAKPSPRLVIKYSQEGKLLSLEKLGPGRQPAWSPDGGKIAYVNQGIWLMDAKGENPRQISDSGEHPCFSPDGKQLAYEQEGGIWLLELDKLQNRQLIKQGRQPAWSPDGSKIVYVNNGIMAWNIAQDKTTALLPKGLNPTWSANGRQLFFDAFSAPQLYFNLWRYDLSSQRLEKIIDDAIQPAVSVNNRYLLYSSSGIWLLRLKEKKFIRLTLYGYEPAYSPQGEKILFSFKGDIWAMDAPYQ